MTLELQVLMWAVVIFVALLGLLWKFAWGPIMHALEERERRIQKTIDDAQAKFKEAEAKAAEHQRHIDKAKDEAAEIIAEGKRDVEKVRAEITAEANREAAKAIERAKREIELAKQAAVEEIREQVVTLTSEVTSKVLAREINADDHRRFVQQAMSEISKS
jgi:F-type H+-transporting ATPase subunit b